MIGQKLSFSENIKEQLLGLRNQGQSYSKLQSWYHSQTGKSIGKTTLYDNLKKWRKEKENWTGIIQEDKKLESLRSELNHYKRLYQTAIKDAAGFDKVVEVAREITTAIPSVNLIFKTPDFSLTTSPQSVIAPLCDTHIGEKVDIEQMGGLNSYDIDIFNKRLYGWANQLVKLVKLRRTYAPVPKLYVPMLGDMVSGDIHLELVKTNLDNVMNQMIRGAHLISQALMFLSQYFDSLYVPCVVGNHGRMVQKPPAKEKYIDWDFLLYEWMAAFCKDQRNIKFSIPKSFLHVFQVEGKNVLIMHGDSIHMWQNIPHYGIIRAIAQLRQTLQFRQGLEEDLLRASSKDNIYNVLASYFDYVILGHFHTTSELDIGTGEAYVAGCVKGGDEFSFGKLHTISKPKQIALYVHPKYGVISKDTIFLERYDKSNEKFIDTLSSVWIEANLGEN